MKIAISLVYTMIVLSSVILIPNIFAENVPEWIKNNAGWWATDQIDDSSFLQGIQYLIKEGIMVIPSTETSNSSSSQEIPTWIKNNAGWWAEDKISEGEFVNAITYLIKVGIIIIESSKSPELIAEMWINGDIDDDEFLANVEQLIEKNIITIQNDSVIKTSQLPDWLVNNAGWWAARIITDSDFSFDPRYTKEEISRSDIEVAYNSLGLRGNEIKEKPDDVYRIFIVGGSTVFGNTEFENSKTWPGYLQQIIDEKITDKVIEVINAGINGATTESEYHLIKNKLLLFDPDLIIMYDGWNDNRLTDFEKTIQNWKSICKLGKVEGFDTIVIVQPLPITGNRVLTEQEIVNSLSHVVGSGASNFAYVKKSQQYVDMFNELEKICRKTVDFRKIFDYVQEPVFYDNGHTISFGNKIIAENVFSVISPTYFGKTYSVIHSNLNSDNNEFVVVYAVGADLSGKNFDNLNLQNAVFDKADLSNTSFKNTNIAGARFVFANLSNSNLLDRTDLSNINLAGIDLSNVNLKGKDLSASMLSGADLTGANLSDTNLSDTILKSTNLTDAILKDADLTNRDLSYTVLSTNLSNMNITGTNLTYSDLRLSDLSGTILSNSILIRANLSNTDLRSTILDNVDFSYAILSYSNLPDSLLVNNNFDNVILNNVNFAGKNLSGSLFKHVELVGSDMQNTNLSNTSLLDVDFTKIKNKSLDGANLFATSFAHSNLSGVSLDNAILDGTNFWKADLSGVDFTVISNTPYGVKFQEANLSNANFEGTDLFIDEVITTVFKNKAHLKILSTDEMIAEIFGDHSQIFVFSTEIRGNDLVIEYVIFTSFKDANLENANFKNADLKFANFYQANLTNADLSGADLRKSYLGKADLSGANMEAANLEGAILDNTILAGANLKCINHPICESG